MEIEIRDAEPGNPAVLALVEALRDEVESRGAHNGVSRPEMSLTEAISADCDTLLAYAGTEPIATAGLKPLSPDMGEIKRMYVAPSHRGAGIAGQMLEELERRARARGFKAIRLDTHDRLSEATRMYSGVGYRQIPDYNSNPRSNSWFEGPLA
jgi:GNAT superfamily N-acetyltransferase